MSVELLDCTLRDGGYVNDWEFGHSSIINIYNRLVESGCEYIEVGFLDDRRPVDFNRSIFPNTEVINELFSGCLKGQAMPVAMIDYGTCSLENISDADNSFVKGIRVIFKKEKIDQAIPYCKEIKNKGYKLFIQAISITAYSDIELLEYLKIINEVKPYAFSIVDTYGLLNGRSLAHYFDIIDNNLDSDIVIGYHSHNNFQLAYSNSMKFLSLATKHNKIVDSTIYGMGKSAGNCASELVAMHMNQIYHKNYDLNQFLEAFDSELYSVYQQHYWGYKYNFYISAMQNCHPNYVQYLLDKKTLTVSAVNEILSMIPEERKLLYNKSLIEELYIQYQSNNIDDSQALLEIKNQVCGKSVVLIGPGKSLNNNHINIAEYIKKENAVTISVNFIPETEYDIDFIFICNAKRYSQLNDNLLQKKNIILSKLIVTSNVATFDKNNNYVLNYASLLNIDSVKNDNALLLCLRMLCNVGVTKVALAGFDGFTERSQDYYDTSYSFGGNDQYRVLSNERTISGLKSFLNEIDISFLTPSLYSEKLYENK